MEEMEKLFAGRKREDEVGKPFHTSFCAISKQECGSRGKVREQVCRTILNLIITDKRKSP